MPRIALSVICFLGSMKASACNLIVLMSWCVYCVCTLHSRLVGTPLGHSQSYIMIPGIIIHCSCKNLLTYLIRRFLSRRFVLRRFLSRRFLLGRFLSRRILLRRFLLGRFLSRKFLSRRFLLRRFLSRRFLSRRFLSRRFLSRRFLSNIFFSRGFFSRRFLSRRFLSRRFLSRKLEPGENTEFSIYDILVSLYILHRTEAEAPTFV